MFLSKSEGNDNLFLERRKAGTGEPRIQKDRTTPEGPPQRFCRFPPNPGGTMGRDTLFLLSESQLFQYKIVSVQGWRAGDRVIITATTQNRQRKPLGMSGGLLQPFVQVFLHEIVVRQVV